MAVKSNSLTVGVAIFVGLSAQAQDAPSLDVENVELAADIVEDMIAQGQIKVNSSGTIQIEKSIFGILEERGLLKHMSINRGGTDTSGQKCKSQ